MTINKMVNLVHDEVGQLNCTENYIVLARLTVTTSQLRILDRLHCIMRKV